MGSDRAQQLASDWVAQHDARTDAVLATQSWIAKEIEQVLSDDALPAAALANGTPAVVALDGNRLCWLTLDSSGEDQIATHFGSLPLSGLSIETTPSSRRPAPGF